MYRNTAGQIVAAQLVAKADGTDVTSGTTTVYVTLDGGTQSAGSGTVTHEGNGTWNYAPTQAETDAGHAVFTFVNSAAVSAAINVYPTVLNDYADALLKRDWTSVTGEAARSVLNALRFLRNKWSISGSTLTVTKEDDTTTAFTSALTSSPTAEGVTASDPS
jgi:hypothetical protein